LIIGKDGQVGRAAALALAPFGEAALWGREDVALESLAALLDNLKPKIVVNAAAWTKVDLAETREREARLVNALLPARLGEWAAKSGALVIHYSTDYVFDGQKQGPYLETDSPRPLSVYGKTKLEGDLALLGSGARIIIFRTSWVYSIIGQNFPKTILALAQKRPELVINDDQTGAPTSADLIAQVTALAVYRHLSDPDEAPTGLYNLAASGRTTWKGYAAHLLHKAKSLGWPLDPIPRLIPRTGSDPDRPAARPLNSSLDCSKLASDFGLFPPNWTWHVDRLLTDLAAITRG
jgi:dTDP-4-dehydrorhamnose reductase